MESLLTESSQWTQGKQRLTGQRVWELLCERGHEVSCRTVTRMFAEWRRRHREGHVPLVYPAGDSAQVDFFEVFVDLSGHRAKVFLFVMRLMHSGRDSVWLYERQDQVSFLDGHVRAFAEFGCVPQRVVYDNLKAAVHKILVGSERQLSPRFAMLVNHYLFEPCFARPYTGHDKGGVESRGRAIRLSHLVPIPAGENLIAVNALLEQKKQAWQTKGGDESVLTRFESERAHMLPLPGTPFVSARTEPVQASRRSLVKCEGAEYSVWSEWRELTFFAQVGPADITFFPPTRLASGVPPRPAVTHKRGRKGSRTTDYRHYLPELAHKPQALRQVAGELLKALGEPFGELWRNLVEERGPKDASRVMARVLTSVVKYGEEIVASRVRESLASDGDILALLRVQTNDEIPGQVHNEVPASLAFITVSQGDLKDYDLLMETDEPEVTS